MPDRRDLCFRPLTADRIPDAISMIRDYYREDGHRFDEVTALSAVRAIAEGGSAGHLWLIESDGNLVGYVCLCEGFSLETGGGDFYLDELYVRPEFRNAGIGRAAISHAEAEAVRLGARRICLEVQASNGKAARLYAGLGYQPHDRGLMSRRL
jgi:ribosomal protein S18 acetylase RimI-like enzyme